jgi:DNA polymerase-3 subunit delta
MPAALEHPKEPLILVWGDDDHGVRTRARQIYTLMCERAGGFDHETIDGAVSNAGDALKAIHRLRASLQTLPFLGGAKVVWLQNCTFLGDDRTASSSAVTDALAGLAQELKAFEWTNVRLLISTGKVDRRKVFYKTLEKIARVETFTGLSAEDRDWEQQAETIARRDLAGRGLAISDEAVAELVVCVGPNLRQLANEVEKLSLYALGRNSIELGDVETIVTRQKHARAFALADALGDRDLPRLLRTLDEELWQIQGDSQRSEIGLLYGLIAKVRTLILVKELLAQGLLKNEASYDRFKAQIARIPADKMPEDKRFNPLAMNAYVLFRALAQSRNFTLSELVQAMETLLTCNRRLISSGLDEALVLQSALVRIVSREPAQSIATARA